MLNALGWENRTRPIVREGENIVNRLILLVWRSDFPLKCCLGIEENSSAF